MASRKKRRISTSDSSTESPVPVSMKSDGSMFQPLNLRAGKPQSSTESPAPSCLSMKSDGSMFQPLNLRAGKPQSSTESPAPSCVSMKSDGSMFQPLNLRAGKPQSQSTGEPRPCSVCKDVSRDLVHRACGHWSCKQCINPDWDQCDSPAAHPCANCGKNTGFLDARKNFKAAMQEKYAWTSEGNGGKGTFLNKIYSELIITTGESDPQHEETVFRHMKPDQQADKQFVNLRDIFKPLPDWDKHQRTVVTKGVAGIGKSFSVQKFVLDWAEEKENCDVDFVFCLSFREMNLIEGKMSLHGLLAAFHPVLQSMKDSEIYSNASVIVILDGLDESRLQLDFKNKRMTSVNEVTSVDNLIVNLIQGNLLPEAKLWITSRPAATSQIPAEFIDVVTEISGFSDSQKEEYFKRRFSHDLSLAERIILHVRLSHNLDIMCQIPIFCWICSVLFEEIFGGNEKAETPQTLTEMMAYFLFVQTKRRNRKYEKETEEDNKSLLKAHREFLLKLGKLAFVQLQDNNLMFYDKDLKDCGIDIKEAIIHSGFCSSFFKEEVVFSQKKIFCFVHLTIQEFFAALFVYDCITNNKTEELCKFIDLQDEDQTSLDLLKMIVDKVSEMKNGHLDFFLRFLLGLVVEPNQRVLQGLLTLPDPGQDTDKKILTYLKAIRRKSLSPDSCINLFQTMVEMRDHKVKDEIQEYLKGPQHSDSQQLTPLHCSAVAFMLQVSKNHVDELDLRKYNASDEGRRRLIPAVRSSVKAILADCKVTEEWVEHLAVGLKFPHSPLKILDLSNNDLKDSGVKLLCAGLSSQRCRIQTLRLSGCMVTNDGCAYLAKAVESNPSHLTELDLSYNNLGESGVKLLNDLVDKQEFKLNKIIIDHGGIHRMKPGFKKYACELTWNPNTAHRNLLLSEGNRKVTWVQEEQKYDSHPERFDHCQQVLSEKGLTGRCYWEAEVEEPFTIGLTYTTIERKGGSDECKLGHNDKSWSLTCSNEGCYVTHNSKREDVPPLVSLCRRVGVYLDCLAETLSFYRVTNRRIHLHTYETTFTGPLHPAVEVNTMSFASLC